MSISLTKSYKPTNPIKYEPHPKIMDDLVTFLRERNHTCALIVGLTNQKFKWCEKDVCPDKLMRDDMVMRDNEAMAFAKNLEAQGHTCVYYMESYPVQIGWCNNTICTHSSNTAE